MNTSDHADRTCLWHRPYVRACPVNTSWLSSSEMKRSSRWVIALNICWYADVSPSLIKPPEQLISCRACSVLCVLCVCAQRACNSCTDCSSAESFCAGWCKTKGRKIMTDPVTASRHSEWDDLWWYNNSFRHIFGLYWIKSPLSASRSNSFLPYDVRLSYKIIELLTAFTLNILEFYLYDTEDWSNK